MLLRREHLQLRNEEVIGPAYVSYNPLPCLLGALLVSFQTFMETANKTGQWPLSPLALVLFVQPLLLLASLPRRDLPEYHGPICAARGERK